MKPASSVTFSPTNTWEQLVQDTEAGLLSMGESREALAKTEGQGCLLQLTMLVGYTSCPTGPCEGLITTIPQAGRAKLEMLRHHHH